MSHCAAGVLRAARSHLPAALVDDAAFAAITAIAAPLPSAFNWLGFECRLAADDRRVDFGVCIDARDRGRATIAGLLARGLPLPGLEFTRSLFAAWVDPDAPIHAACPALWVEWDLVTGATSEPFAFVCVDPGFPDVGSRAALPPAELRAVTAEVSTRLGAPLATTTLDRLLTTAAVLPPSARILHVAPMPTRGAGLRVHTSLPRTDLPAWLAAIAWPGDRRAAAWACELCRGIEQVGVQFTLDGEVAPYLGLECYSLADPRTDPTWERLFAGLIAAGLCSPDKAAAALRWFGDETVDMPDAQWLTNIQRQFYVKLVLAGSTLTAKVYLTLHPRFIPW